MGIFDSVQDFFLPTPETARQRRLDVFGTESKAIVGTVIGASAVAAIAAAPVVAAAGVRGVATSALRTFGGLSLPTKAAVVLAAPIAAGAITKNPKIIPRTAGGLVNLETNLYEAAKDPSLEKVKDVFKENPVLATGLTALSLGGVATGIVAAINALRDRDLPRDREPPDRDVPEVVIPTSDSGPVFSAHTPSEPSVRTKTGSPIPITPETQVLGREATSESRIRKRRRSVSPSLPSLRVQILNQNSYIEA